LIKLKSEYGSNLDCVLPYPDSSKIAPDVNCDFSVDSSGIENQFFSFQPRQYEIIILKRRSKEAIFSHVHIPFLYFEKCFTCFYQNIFCCRIEGVGLKTPLMSHFESYIRMQ
jgi:hypothetical protein